MIKYIYFILLIVVSGCSTEQTIFGDKPFMEMEEISIYSPEQYNLCEKEPESIFCMNSPSIGDIQPTRAYALEVLKDMNSNFTYTHDDTWHYNDTVYEYLSGDCEDIASTMAKHIVNDGIDKRYLFLALRKIGESEYHIFLAVDTSDAGMLHLDYSNSGYPIEPRINFHMRMDDVGIHKWIKGNIQ